MPLKPTKNKYLSIPVTERIQIELDKAANRCGMTRAGLVRQWLKERLAKQGKRS